MRHFKKKFKVDFKEAAFLTNIHSYVLKNGSNKCSLQFVTYKKIHAFNYMYLYVYA